MRSDFSMKETALMLCYLLIAILIGVLTKIFQLDGLESLIVLQFQKMIAYGIPVQVFLIITYLGDIRFLIVLSLIFFTYSYYRRRRLDEAFELLAFLVIATVSTYILKELFGRERPFIYSKNITSYADENDFSYPSGHVSRSLGAYSIIFKGYKRGDIICSLLTVFISLSRIVLGAHYFTDLVGAIFLSLFSGKLARILLQSINKRFMLLGKM